MNKLTYCHKNLLEFLHLSPSLLSQVLNYDFKYFNVYWFTIDRQHLGGCVPQTPCISDLLPQLKNFPGYATVTGKRCYRCFSTYFFSIQMCNSDPNFLLNYIMIRLSWRMNKHFYQIQRQMALAKVPSLFSYTFKNYNYYTVDQQANFTHACT